MAVEPRGHGTALTISVCVCVCVTYICTLLADRTASLPLHIYNRAALRGSEIKGELVFHQRVSLRSSDKQALLTQCCHFQG